MSLVATRLQNWRVENPEFDRNMARPLEYGALDFFIEQTNAANSIANSRYQLRWRRDRFQRPFVRHCRRRKHVRVVHRQLGNVGRRFHDGSPTVQEQRNFLRTRLCPQDGKGLPRPCNRNGRASNCRP